MSSPYAPQGPAVPGYPTYGQPGGQWPAGGAADDTGPIPRQVADPGARRSSVDVAKALGLVVAALGALNFLFGFLPELTASRSQDSLSVFAVGPAYVPVLLLIGGLLALAALLPGGEVSRLAVAAVSVGGAAGAIVSLGTQGAVQLVSSTQVSKGMGAILLVIFGIIQAVVAIGAYVVGADSVPWGRRAAPAGGSAPGAPVAAASAQGVGVGGSAGWAGAAGGGGGAGGWSAAAGTPAGWTGAAGAPGAQGATGGWTGGGRSAGGGYSAPSGAVPSSGYPGAVQPGWYGAPEQRPADDRGTAAGVDPRTAAGVDPRNAEADDRPTGPQQVVVGTESARDQSDSRAAGSTGPVTDVGAKPGSEPPSGRPSPAAPGPNPQASGAPAQGSADGTGS
jgi:hypothetical protein